MAVEVREVEVALTRPLRAAVLRAGSPQEALAAEPPGARCVAVLEAGRVLSCGLIAADTARPGAWRIRGMATEPGMRERGLGSAVLAALVEIGREEGAFLLWCNARTPALSLYERAGFRSVSEEFEIEGIGPHHVMELELGRRPQRAGA